MKEEQIILTDSKQSKLGRPVKKPDPVIVENLLIHVANGGTVRAFCREKNNPSYNTIYRWLDKDKELMTRFTHVSRFLGARAIAEEALELVDTPPPVIGDGDNARLDNSIVTGKRVINSLSLSNHL